MKIEMRSHGTVQEIHRDPPSQELEESVYSDTRTAIHPPPKTIQLPLWIPAVTLAFLLLLIMGLCFWIWQLQKASLRNDALLGNASSSAIGLQSEKDSDAIAESPYLPLAQIKETALSYASLTAEEVVFIATKLSTKQNPAQYEIIFLHKDAQYEYLLHAETGALLHHQMLHTDMVVDQKAFLPPETFRQLALDCAGLNDAVFTKEKLDQSNDIYCYQLAFYDAAQRHYTVLLHAETGAVLKYEVEEPKAIDASKLISLEEAKQQALIRAGILSNDANVTFTKEKRSGSVYLLAFTLEDGTQYTIELDGYTGMANTVDVVPISADTSNFLGFSEAKRLAIEKAGLSADTPVVFTKAKIDRGTGVYVYELEFETDAYEYEVWVHTLTGEIIKYKAWFR